MATAIKPGDEEKGKKGRRRRAKARAEALADSAVTIPIAETVPVAPVAPPPSETSESPLAAAVRVRRERKRAEAGVAQVAPPAAAAPEPAAEPTPAEPEEFHDLLGQAIGLRLDAVTREFDAGDMKVVALRDVSLEIGPGEFVAVIGPSGCGKTTLLSMMGGLDKPTSGQVYASGMALDQLTDDELADYRLQRVSTIFQTFNLAPAMSAEENVMLPLTLAGVPPDERRMRARRLLELVGLKGRSRVRASRLSGGEQQKVAVARALANRPGLVLADEPTGSLDSAAGERILDLLLDLHRRGATVVLVTHDPEVARHAQRAVRMVDGRAYELGSGSRNVRMQDPLLPAPRMHWRDTLRLGLLSAGRRPLRTFLTTTGVAIGIAAMSLIVALSGGLDYALAAPAFAHVRTDVVSVLPASDSTSAGFNSQSMQTLAALPHVEAAWGQVAVEGSFAGPNQTFGGANDALIALAPRSRWDGSVHLIAGSMPTGDSAQQVVLSAREANALGFINPRDALGAAVVFKDAAQKPVPLTLKVVGVAADATMPAGVAGGLVPYNLMTDHWSAAAVANNWKTGEFTAITLLVDSGSNVGGVRDRVARLGFQAEATGDQERAFAELLSRLRVALLGLSVVALFLACLGIANTMYTAVLERTREIGTLKAVGARSRDVMLLFVAEAAVIGLAGGVAGGIVAAVLSGLGNTAVDALVPALAASAIQVFRPDVLVAIAALVLAVALSMGSGLLPAMRAAAQQPMKALHHE
ncbi:MAG TPA: ATP-binding cassette domain-containing protein [Candidatus Dormibacteraeota bacterium]|nr:ATP-binding cassette domain-containing protein [Candidatus Dormibacteraeota bacterium]